MVSVKNLVINVVRTHTNKNDNYVSKGRILIFLFCQLDNKQLHKVMPQKQFAAGYVPKIE
ncbi:hypothetical protein [Turicimonas sp. TL08]